MCRTVKNYKPPEEIKNLGTEILKEPNNIEKILEKYSKKIKNLTNADLDYLGVIILTLKINKKIDEKIFNYFKNFLEKKKKK